MPLTPGTRVGPYEIGAPLGRGGMGEVYRARDTRLNRDVAVKILSRAVTSDADRVARFAREAQTLAALNHSHIAQIYGVEEFQDTRALVMELVEGLTLADRLARGRLPVSEALGIARQIADALEAAHEKGIIHRDLKPANVKVTPDDRVKVLDFGLAKTIEPTDAGATGEPGDLTTHAAGPTEAGVILGTAAYMSPEQARGKPVDRRTDIWAFGCVLYEMLAGKRAFAAGDTASDAIAAVLTSDIDWNALPGIVPQRVRTLLERCLQKDPQKRLPHIGLARFEIDDASGERGTGAGTPLARPPMWKRAATVAAAGVVAALAAISAWLLKPLPAPVVTRFSMTLPAGQEFTNTGRQAIVISPDGLNLVYVANGRLYLRTLSSEEPQPLAGTEGAKGVFQPTFSPDGRSIAFVAGVELKRIALNGGTATPIATLKAGLYGLSWSGDHLVFGDSGTRILRVPVAGGTPEELVSVTAPELVSSPSMLPGGNHLLFTHAKLGSQDRWDKAQVVVQSLRTGERKTIVDGGADGRYVPSGHLMYAVGGVVYGASFDLDRLEMRETPAPMIEGLRRGGPTGAAQFAISESGSLVYLPGTSSRPSESELFVTDARGNTRRLGIRGGQYQQPRLSPDGRHVAFNNVDPRQASVWVYELSGASAMRRLALDGNAKYPVWSADSQRLIFQSDREGDRALFQQRADGTGTAERVTRPDQGTAHIAHSSSPDGEHLLYSATKERAATLWVYSFRDRKAAQVAGVTSTDPLGASFSPDGRFIAYYANPSGETLGSRIYVAPFPLNSTRYQVGGGYHAMWSADGRQLIVPRTQGRVGVITVSTQPTFSFSEPAVMSVPAIGGGPLQSPRAFDIGRDGTLVGVITAGNLEALTNNREIRVVLNWRPSS